MKLLVTGVTGFIGSRLALHLKSLGADVTATGQCNSPIEDKRLAELKNAGVRTETGPLQNAELARRLTAGQDIVIHLAAAQHEANVPDSYFREVNVEGTRTLLEASRAAGVKRFIYGSSIGVYGAAADGVLNEDSPPQPQNAYGRSKLEAEGVVKECAGELETCIVRISEVYGPGDMRLLKLFRAIDKGRFMMIGAGTNRRQTIHVRDLIEGLLAAAAHPAAAGEIFVLAGQEVVTTRGLVEKVSAALGRRPPSRHLPLWPFLAAAVTMEATLKPLGIQPPLHRRRLDFFRKSFVFDTNKAEAMLGFKPQVDLTAGLAETAAWYRTNGYLS